MYRVVGNGEWGMEDGGEERMNFSSSARHRVTASASKAQARLTYPIHELLGSDEGNMGFAEVSSGRFDRHFRG